MTPFKLNRNSWIVFTVLLATLIGFAGYTVFVIRSADSNIEKAEQYRAFQGALGKIGVQVQRSEKVHRDRWRRLPSVKEGKRLEEARESLVLGLETVRMKSLGDALQSQQIDQFRSILEARFLDLDDGFSQEKTISDSLNFENRLNSSEDFVEKADSLIDEILELESKIFVEKTKGFGSNFAEILPTTIALFLVVIVIFILGFYRIGQYFFKSEENQRLAVLNQRKFEALFEQSLISTLIFDQNGAVLGINQAALSTLGIGNKEMRGKKIAEFSWWPTSFKETVGLVLKQASKDKQADFSTFYFSEEKGMMRFDGEATRMESDDGKTFIVLLLRDTTNTYFEQEDAGLFGWLNHAFREGENLEEVLVKVMEKLKGHFGLKEEEFWIYDENHSELEIQGFQALSASKPQFTTGARRLALSGKTELVSQVYLTRLAKWEQLKGSTQFTIAFPLVINNNMVGVVKFTSTAEVRKASMLIEPLRLCLVQAGILIEKYRNEEKIRRNETLLRQTENLADSGGFEWRPGKDMLLVSGGLLKILGVEDDFQWSLRRLLKYVHPDDLAFLMETIRKRSAEKTLKSKPFRILDSHRNTKTCVIRGNIFRSELGEVDTLIVSIIDITDFAAIEDELNSLIVELERSNKELEQFAYVASHDLQEPLRKIRAFGDRLNRFYVKDPDLPGKDYVARMQNAAERMQGLIEDLLVFSRVSRNLGERTEVDLNVILKEAVENLETVIEEKAATVEIPNLPTLTGVRVQLGQLFQNLLSNALKFSREGIPPKVTVTYELVSGESLLDEAKDLSPHKNYYKIEVQDNGIGFEEKYLNKIFTIFQRLHGRTEFSGTGIGLAVCQKIAENHLGYITARGKLGVGATFVVYFPENI